MNFVFLVKITVISFKFIWIMTFEFYILLATLYQNQEFNLNLKGIPNSVLNGTQSNNLKIILISKFKFIKILTHL